MTPSAPQALSRVRPADEVIRDLVALAGGQIHAADYLGVSQASISRWSNGAPVPASVEKLARIIVGRLDTYPD